MYKLTYHKFGNKWYLDYPEYLERGGREEDLERIGGFHALLDIASDDNLNACLLVNLEPFEGADIAVLTGSSGGRTGGYYFLHQFNGQVVDLELWVNKLVYLGLDELPDRLYVKKLTP